MIFFKINQSLIFSFLNRHFFSVHPSWTDYINSNFDFLQITCRLKRLMPIAGSFQFNSKILLENFV